MLIKLSKYLRATGLSGLLLLMYPVLIMVIIRGRTLDQAESVDVAAGIQIIYIVICFIVSINQIKKRVSLFKKILFIKPTTYLLTFTFLGFFSAIWSSSPILSFYRSFECLVFILLITNVIVNLVIKYDLQYIVKWVVFYALWNLTINIFLKIKLIGFGYLLYPFTASRLFFPLFFFFFIFLIDKKYLKFLILVFALLGLSNKIYFGVAIGSLGLVFGTDRNIIILLLIFLILSLLFFAVGIDEFLLNSLFYGRDSIGLEDSSGRDKVWSYLYEKGVQKPILGYGFSAGEVNLLEASVFKGAINAHNSFMSAFVNNGIIGLILLLFYFISALRLSFSKWFPKGNWRTAVISTLILVFVVNMAAPGIGGRVYGTWIPSVFLISLFTILRLKFKSISSFYHEKITEQVVDNL
ncbi:O-antigen ligase family protein [Seonamhaeicola sp. MEBiC1930]|uniref:O-antigen ligase family protein n=1 Tax=Seonamhaeicola sp. MEBiC01930 TaxID=2976768 RepID=UPI003244003F